MYRGLGEEHWIRSRMRNPDRGCDLLFSGAFERSLWSGDVTEGKLVVQWGIHTSKSRGSRCRVWRVGRMAVIMIKGGVNGQVEQVKFAQRFHKGFTKEHLQFL